MPAGKGNNYGIRPSPGLARDDRAGRYRRRISIEAPPEPQGTDSYGDPDDLWEVVAEVWGDVLALGGRRELVSEQLVLINNYRVEIRWRAGITAQMRLVVDGEKLNILSVSNPDRRQIALVLECESWEK